MYVPKSNEETDIAVLHGLIKSKPFGAWSAIANGSIVVNHLPFYLREQEGEFATLVGHVARANNIHQQLCAQATSVVVFQGEQAYISPSWYPSKHQHGKAVPTWNYAVVHAEGVPKVIDDSAWLLHHVTELTNTHENSYALPWKVSDAPADYIEKLCGAIVGIEIPIVKLTGKWKLGQNRSDADKHGMVDGLIESGDTATKGMADLISQHISASTE